jgi:hypothetical protein
MTASASELAALRAVASRLGPLRKEVVFVGGMIRGLLISDPGASGSRPTDDIDVVAEVGSRAEYYELAERLQALGFVPDRRERAPLCRWLIDGLTVDVMPDHENVLGLRIPAIVNTWTAHREHPVIGAKRRAPIGAKRRVLLGSRPVVDDPFYDAPRRLLGGSVRVQPSVPSLVLRREGPLRASL